MQSGGGENFGDRAFDGQRFVKPEVGQSGRRCVNPRAVPMSEREDPEFGQETPLEGSAGRELLPPDPEAGTGAGSAAAGRLLPVPVFVTATFRAEPIDEPRARRTSSARPLLAWAAAIAAAGVLAGGALWAFDVHRSQASLLAEQAHESRALAKTIDALGARLSAMESARPRDELVELRRSVGEIRSSVASSRDLSGAIAQLAQRVEKLDREESAKVDRINERVDRETSAEAAELAARIDKLEKKAVVAAAPAPTPAKPPSPPQRLRRRRKSAPKCRWRRRARSSGSDRCCAVTSFWARETTWPLSRDAMASARFDRATFSRAQDASSGSRARAAPGRS